MRTKVESGLRSLRRPQIPAEVVCGLVAVFVAALAVLAAIAPYDFALSVLVHMSASEPMARIAGGDPGFVFVDPAAHYDGVYFYAIAHDPFIAGLAHTLIDAPANRYGHPLYGWLANIVSLGRLPSLPYALLLISLVGMFSAGALASRLGRLLGASPWIGLTVAFNPGLVYAVTVDTTEALGAALLFGVLVAWASGRRALASALLVPLCFAKEPLLAVPVGLALWECVRFVRGRWRAAGAVRALLATVALLAPGPLVYTAWYGYVRLQLGAFPFEQGLDRLSLPFTGWADTLRMAAELATADFFAMQSGQPAVAFLATALGAILVSMIAAFRFRTLADPVLLLSGALLLCLGWLPLLYPKDLIRIAAFWLALLPFVLLARPGASPRVTPESPGTGTAR